MELNGYFDPVSLNRPAYFLLPEKFTFARNIAIHTPDHPIKNLHHFQVAIIGLPQDEGAVARGSAESPDQIRSMLYQLRKINNIKIYDLGNLKTTSHLNDSYYAIRDITLELVERAIIPVFIGGSHDLSYGVILALQKAEGLKHIVTVDPRLDFQPNDSDNIHSLNYLNSILKDEIIEQFTYSNIGHQQYFVSDYQTDMIEDEQMESIRLGQVKENLQSIEPVIRDADFISIDMNAVRHSDAPGSTIPSPNGFFGNEICAISRYAGLSDQVKAFGLYEVDSKKDINNQTCHLAAQLIWYFLEGLSYNIKENPLDEKAHTKKFILTMNKVDQELRFHKSTVSDRWWIEIPVINPVTKQNYYISCSYDDYKQACNNVIPERWWRYYDRLT